MKKLIGTMILLFGISHFVFATPVPGNDATFADQERVEKISLLNGIYGWNNLDGDSIIVWATPFQPFLINLSGKSPGLRFADTIAITSTAGYVYDKFDSVIVDGLRYPIRSIYRLDRASARNMQRHS